MEVPGKKTDTDEENEVNLDKLCELCEADNVNTKADGFCRECEEYMCSVCFRQHVRPKSCKHHMFLNINTVSEKCLRINAGAIKCKQHDGESIKYYCRKHEVVGCGDCMVNGHNACNSKYIKDLSDNFDQNQEYKTLMRKLKKLISERMDFETEIHKNKQINKSMHEKALKDIRQFRLDVNEYLDKAEASMIAKAFDIMEENERLLTKLDHDCKTLSTEHIEITEKLDRELFKDNVLFIHAVECKPKLTASERYISEMKSMQIKTFKFEFDQQLRNILSSARNFGTYAISTSAVFNKNTKLADDEGKNDFYILKGIP